MALTLGWVPEWLKGADCKSAGSAFSGSNPLPTTIIDTTETKVGRRVFFHIAFAPLRSNIVLLWFGRLLLISIFVVWPQNIFRRMRKDFFADLPPVVLISWSSKGYRTAPNRMPRHLKRIVSPLRHIKARGCRSKKQI